MSIFHTWNYYVNSLNSQQLRVIQENFVHVVSIQGTITGCVELTLRGTFSDLEAVVNHAEFFGKITKII